MKGKKGKKGGKGEKAENLLVKEEGADEEVSPDEKKLREKVEKHCKEAADEMACGEEVDKRGEELQDVCKDDKDCWKEKMGELMEEQKKRKGFKKGEKKGEDKKLIKEGDGEDLDDLSEDDLKKLKQWCKDHPEDCKEAKKEGKEMMLIKEEEDEVEELVELDKGDLKALCEEDP